MAIDRNPDRRNVFGKGKANKFKYADNVSESDIKEFERLTDLVGSEVLNLSYVKKIYKPMIDVIKNAEQDLFAIKDVINSKHYYTTRNLYDDTTHKIVGSKRNTWRNQALGVASLEFLDEKSKMNSWSNIISRMKKYREIVTELPKINQQYTIVYYDVIGMPTQLEIEKERKENRKKNLQRVRVRR